jgi:hypothetical protein
MERRRGRQGFGTILGSEITSLDGAKVTGTFGGERRDREGHTYGDELSLEIKGATHKYGVTLETWGGNNVVLRLDKQGKDVPGILIRVARAVERETSEQAQIRAKGFKEETSFMRKLSEQSIVPKIHASLSIEGRYGFAIERFDCSLDAVQDCPALMRRMFREFDGESAVVSLFARASTIVRCIDMKPGNVVVRWRDGEPLMALIDIDGTFCRESRDPDVRNPVRTVAELAKALGKLNASSAKKESAIVAATMGLLVFCFVATISNCSFGFPYIKIAGVLISQWEKVTDLVKADFRGDPVLSMTALSIKRKTVIGLLKAYYDEYGQNTHGQGAIIDLTAGRDTVTENTIEFLMEEILKKLQRRIKSAASVALARIEQPALYEYAALVIATAIPYPRGMSKLRPDAFVGRVTDLHGTRKIIAKCLLKSCPDHDGKSLIAAPNAGEGADPNKRGRCTIM